jgi:sulfite reductase alpha subunit-like flavoprotein
MQNIDDKMLTVEAEIMLKGSNMQGDKQQALLGVLEQYGLSKVEAMKALLELTRVIEDVEDE